MKWIGTQTIYNDVRVRGNVNVERLVKITNTNTSSASEGGKLTLISNDGAALGDDHQLGRVAFQAAEDSSSTIRQGASIEAYADAAWSASENGTRLEFYINDGNNSIEKALTLDSDLLATFAGAVTVTGALTGTLATATQPNIESIGTDGDSLHILADQLIMSNTSTDTPVINLVNTTDDDQAGQLIFEKLRDDDAVASGQNLGEIWFRGQDSAQNTEDYAVIIGEIDVSTSGQESGKLNFHVAGHDGSTRTAMTLTGGSEGTEVDATIGLGANSVVTIPGAIQPATVIASAYLDADTAHLSGAQTFTGTKTLNSFKGTAGATVTNILDEDAMGSNSATALATQQSIKAYADTKVSKDTTKQFTHHQITDDIDATDVVFISLGEIDAETTTSTNTKLPILAPVAGKLLKVFIRTSAAMNGVNFTVKLYTRTISQSTNGAGGEVGAQTGAGPTNKTMATYDFTSSLDSGTNAIAEGDKVSLSIESSGATANAHFFISCLWEWDLS